MKLKVLLLLSTVLMLVVNIMANIVPFNNQTTAQISDSFKVFFVPAGYVFAIWGVIYVGLIAFNILAFMPRKNENKKVSQIIPVVIISNLANTLWIFMWHYNYLASSVLIMFALLVCLINIYMHFNVRKDLSKNEYLLGKIPFSIYLSWISVATIANITDLLYARGWDGFGLSGPVWASILVVVAACLAIFFLLKHRDVAYALVFIWAVIGIAVNFSGVSPLNVISFGSSLVVAFVVLYTIYKKFLRKV